MNKAALCLSVILALACATATRAESVRVSGAFGGAVYSENPFVDYPSGGRFSLPGNYAISLATQAEGLPFNSIAFIVWDRFWSGGDIGFSNSANVVSAGIGKSFPLGYSKFELLVGLSHYDETFELSRTSGGAGKFENATVGGLAGGQLVFRSFENVNAVVSYRLLVRDAKTYQGELDDGRAFNIETNPLDHVIEFGVGYEFGG